MEKKTVETIRQVGAIFLIVLSVLTQNWVIIVGAVVLVLFILPSRGRIKFK